MDPIEEALRGPAPADPASTPRTEAEAEEGLLTIWMGRPAVAYRVPVLTLRQSETWQTALAAESEM